MLESTAKALHLNFAALACGLNQYIVRFDVSNKIGRFQDKAVK